tara:strand:- start:160004 stop:160318 length:315 start_codon:yes stop_codon:yes gene_type:complete
VCKQDLVAVRFGCGSTFVNEADYGLITLGFAHYMMVCDKDVIAFMFTDVETSSSCHFGIKRVYIDKHCVLYKRVQLLRMLFVDALVIYFLKLAADLATKDSFGK